MTFDVGGRWHVIVERGAPASPYDENVAEVPGAGVCVRDDGRTGPPVELLPDGWRLIDIGCEMVGPDDRRDRLYLACPDDVTCWREHASASRRWRAADGELVLDGVS